MNNRNDIKVGFALVALVVGLATPAHADPTTNQDATFQRLLAGDGTMSNFPLEKMQGLRACGQLDRGIMDDDAVINELMAQGSYSFDVANSIVSAAEVAYCPRHAAQ